MKRTVLLLVFIAPFVLLVTVLLVYNQEKLIGKSLRQQASSQKLHQNLFFEPHSFYQGINVIKDSDLTFNQKIKGGIVPHHLLASELLSDFFAKLSKQAPEVIILVGPNHKAEGKNILTIAWSWETPFGNVDTEIQIVGELVAKGFADRDDEIVGNEHSVGGIMPYLAYYLPNTKVIPIILSSSTSLSNVQKLGDYLAEIMADKSWIIVASVDFAHEVTSQESEVNDAVTESLIRNFDLMTLFTLDNKYLDSAPAIGVLLTAMQKLGTTNIETLDHSNSGLLLGAQPSSVTSYFEMIFYPPSQNVTGLPVDECEEGTPRSLGRRRSKAMATEREGGYATEGVVPLSSAAEGAVTSGATRLRVGLHKAVIPRLTIDRIFSANHELGGIPQDEARTIIVAGDVLLARGVNYQMHKQKNFKLPFENVAEVLQDADLTVVNLENPIVEDCSLTNQGMVFCGSPETVSGLTYAGVDIASVANNHCRDRGEVGLQETVEILEKNNIAALVQGEVLIEEVRGLKFAFLGYDTIRATVSRDELKSSIENVREVADVVIIYFHWGVEYVAQPTTKQKDLARLAIDSGVDLVLGSHPHWVQGVEIYKDRLIVYSHGNFIFDQMWSEETKTGVIGKYTFYKDKLVDVEFLPLYMQKFPSPHLLTGNEKKEVLDIMQQRSILE